MMMALLVGCFERLMTSMGARGFWIAERIGAEALLDRIGDECWHRVGCRAPPPICAFGAELFGIRRGDELRSQCRSRQKIMSINIKAH